MTLQLLICTYNEGILRIPALLLPPTDEVSYMVSFQYDDEYFLTHLDHPCFHRPDVTLTQIHGRGLAANRNHALSQATGDIMLLSDDDVSYRPEQLQRVVRHFQEDQDLDIACFRAAQTDGSLIKSYAPHPFSYQEQPRGTYFSSIEIALRPTARLPRFDERFGLGAPFLSAGEEEVFLWQAYRQGLRIWYFPETIVTTPPNTTGSCFFTTPSVQRSKGAVLCVMHGPIGAWLRCLKFAFTHMRHGHPLRMLREMTRGILYVKS